MMEHGGTWWAMWAMMIVFWTIVITGAWLLVAALRERHHSPDAEEILAHRLARGEIGREEYRELKQEMHQQ